jgi:hypothetical protein
MDADYIRLSPVFLGDPCPFINPVLPTNQFVEQNRAPATMHGCARERKKEKKKLLTRLLS